MCCCRDKAQCIFRLGIACLIQGFLMFVAQSLLFGYCVTRHTHLQLGVIGVGFSSGIFLVLGGIINIRRGYQIRQMALFQQPALGPKGFHSQAVSVILFNSFSLASATATVIVAAILAKNTYIQGNFWTNIDPFGNINESTDTYIFAGAIAMGMFSFVGMGLSIGAVVIGNQVLRRPQQTLEGVFGNTPSFQDVEPTTCGDYAKF